MSRAEDASGRDFWSRRKAHVRAEEEAEARAEAQIKHAKHEADAENKSDDEILQAFNLPHPDTLEMGDDVKGFMQEGIPARLRQSALRRLWRLNPVLANVDGLVDYGEDFTDAAMVPETLATTYEVGKGMLAHIKALAQENQAQEESISNEEAEPDREEEDTVEEDIAVSALDEEPRAVAPIVDAEDSISHRPTRRMRFDFDDA